MSEMSKPVTTPRRRAWLLSGAALATALATAAPAWAQSAEDLNYAELGRLNAAVPAQPAMPSTPQPAVPAAPSTPAYAPAGSAAAAPGVDCNNPYYTQYCQTYSAWLSQNAAPYGYGYDYGDD